MATPRKPREEHKPSGAPTTFREEYCEQARKLCLLGLIDEQLAKSFDIPVSTLNNWKHAHPKFMESIKAGREGADSEVAAALYHRAKGYSHDEDDIRTVTLPGPGGGSTIVITPTTKHYPPDTAAAKMWLTNRNPNRWRDKVDVEHTGPNGGPIQTANLSPSEFAEVAKKMAQEI